MVNPFKQFAQSVNPFAAFAAKPDPMADRIAAAKAGTLRASPDSLARAASADRIAEDQMILAEAGPVLSGLTKFNQGVPFIGEWTDEITGMVGGERAMQAQRAVQDAMGRQYPKTSMGLQVAGGITGSIPLAGMAGPSILANAPASMGGRMAAAGLAGAVAGGTEGAIQGAGANAESRGDGAIMGGAIGAGLGGAVGAVAPMAAAGVKALVSRYKSSDVSTIARQFGVSPEAARIVKRSLMNDDLDAAEQALRAAGPDAMLADAGVGTRQLLDDAMTAGGPATRIGREAVEQRAATAAPEINQALDAVLGPDDGIKSASKGIASRTAGVRQQAYTRAYAQPIDYADASGQAIEGVLQRVPPRTLNAAIDEANEAMREAGVRNMQIMAEIAPDGSVSFREMPNVQQLDELKKALGAVAQKETDPLTGKISAAGIRAQRLARDLRDAVTDAVPSYRTAVKLGGDKIAEDQALTLGRRVLSGATTREEVAEIASGMSREAKAAFKQGLRGQIDDALANVQRTITDPNTDAREAMKVIKDLSSRANRQKVTAVLGPSEAGRLFGVIDRATTKLELRSAVATNSKTAVRTAGREAMDAELAPGIAGRAARGEPVGAVKSIVQALTNTTPQADLARKQALYADIARSLTSIRGQDAADAMALVRQAMNGQPLTDAQAGKIARLVTTGGALAAYQTGSQSLSPLRRGK